MNNDFSDACSTGQLNIDLVKNGIYSDYKHGFRMVCKNGHLEYLMTFEDNLDIHAHNDKGFRYACRNGRLNIYKKINI